MLRFVWVLAIITAVTLFEAVHAASPPPPVKKQTARASAAPASALAPADEYFGRQKLSVVRMHHQVFALKDDLHNRRRHPDAIENEANWIGDAYFDWANRFPGDRWLPRMAWEIATLYEELPGIGAQSQAFTFLAFISQHYTDSEIARDAANDLTRGIGVRPWPRWAGREPAQRPTLAGQIVIRDPRDPQALLQAVQDVGTRLQGRRIVPAAAFGATAALEGLFRNISPAPNDDAQQRCAWQIATLYELLPGTASRDRAIKMLALVLDRYGNTEFGLWSLRDLQRGVGIRT